MNDAKWLYTLVTSTFIFISICYFSQNRKKQHQNKKTLPPCPPSLPVIGHLHLLKTPLHRTFNTLSDQYGSIFSLKLGNQYTVVISSPAAVEECFVKNDIVLANRPQTQAGKYLNYDSTTLGSSNYGQHWRNIRRILNQEVFSMSRQNMFLYVRQNEIKQMMKSLFFSTSQRRQKVEMKSRISEVSFNIVVGIVTGKRYYGEGVDDSIEAKEFQEIVREVFDLSGASNPGDFLTYLKLIDFGGYKKKMMKLKNRIDKVLQNLIEESKMNNGGVQRSMLSNLLQLHEDDSASVSDKIIKGLMLVLIIAGTDTTAITIEWCMSLLLNNPKKLKKAQSELDTVIGLNRLVQESDYPNLTYIQSIVIETLRLYPAAPLLVPHYSSNECTIQGYHIPQNTMLLVNAWSIHRNPEIWNEPLNFKPERFMNVEEKSYVYKFIPFGIGRRSCPGANMAYKVVGMVIASLIQCFEWERIGVEEVDMCEGDGLSMPKVMPLEVMCQPRKDMINVLSSL